MRPSHIISSVFLVALFLSPVPASAQRGSPKEMRPPVERNDRWNKKSPPVDGRKLLPPAERDDSRKEMMPPVEALFQGPTRPTFGAAAAGETAGATSVVSASLTANGTNRYLACAVAIDSPDDLNPTVSAVSYAGHALTFRQGSEYYQGGSPGLSAARVEFWDLPLEGVVTVGTSSTITATLSQSAPASIGCVLYTLVNQTTPYGTLVTNGNRSPTSTVTVASSTAGTVLHLVSVNMQLGTLKTATPDGTQRVQQLSSVATYPPAALISETAGATSVTSTWTWDDVTNYTWGAVGVPLIFDSGGGPPPPPPAGQITVCATFCDYTNGQLQNALDAAHDGDEVLVQSGFTYVLQVTDGYVLGPGCKVAAWNCITLRTGVTASGVVMPRSVFPIDGLRVNKDAIDCPHGACRGIYAKFIPHFNNEPAIRTVYPGENYGAGFGGCSTIPCVGNGWSLKWLEVIGRVQWPERTLIRFGTNKQGKTFNGTSWVNDLPNGEWQDTLVEVPHHLSLIQCDVHGDPVAGQYGGLLLASGDTRVIGNSFRDIKSNGETQAITGLNGIGPHLIENNHIEATGENVMWGGSDTYLQNRAVITGSPTTTVFNIGTPVWYHEDGTTQVANLTTDIYSGIFITVIHSGVTYSGFTCTLSSVTSSTATCTLSKTLPVTPSAGDVVQWCWLTGGITFRYNHVYKPPAWMQTMLTTPTGLTVTPFVGGTGSLSPGTYCYRVLAYAFVSISTWTRSLATTEVCGVLSGVGRMAISWNPAGSMINAPTDPPSHGYRLYGRTSGAENQYWDVVAPTTFYVDTGVAGGSETPTTTVNYYNVKNNFELKHSDGGSPAGASVIEYNVFDYSWCCTQDNLITLKAHNQDGRDISTTVRNTAFRNNWGRHASRAITLVSSDAVNHVSGVMTDVTVSNNLFTDLSRAWIFPYQVTSDLVGQTVLMAGGGEANIVGSSSCIRCTYSHNTFLVQNSDMHGPLDFELNASDDKYTDLVVKDNIMARESTDAAQISANFYGVVTAIADVRQVNGTTSWNAATQGTSVASFNEWPESNSTRNSFSTSSFFHSQATLQTYFVNYAECVADTITSCALTGSSPLDSAASDGTDVGANIAAIKVGTDIALSGDLSSPVSPPLPSGGSRIRLRIRVH